MNQLSGVNQKVIVPVSGQIPDFIVKSTNALAAGKEGQKETLEQTKTAQKIMNRFTASAYSLDNLILKG